MNKKLKTFCADNGMTLEGNSAYGALYGYDTSLTLHCFDNKTPLKVHISFYATDEQKRGIESALRNAAIKFCTPQFTQCGLLLGLNDMTLGRLIKRLPALLEQVCGIISDNGGLGDGYCPVCGNKLDETNVNRYNYEGFKVNLDGDCVANLNAVIDAENRDFNEAPNNYLLGFIGALIGGLVGAACSVLIYIAGFISSISAIISIFLGAFLYQKFHGKQNKMMIVIVSVTTLVCMIVSVLAIYIVAAGIAAKQSGLNISAIDAFDICMNDPDFSRLFFCDLAMVIIFTVIGIGCQIYYLIKKIKRKQNIR